MESVLKVIESIEHCLLPKLSKNYDECEDHPEYTARINKLDQYFPVVINLLGDFNLREHLNLATSVLSTLIIMYKELQSDGDWNNEKTKEYSRKLNHHFECLYEITLEDLLRKENIHNIQEVYDKCMENLNRKLTSDEFKKYPGRIEVYCCLVKNIEEYKVEMKALQALPVSLLLVDDHIDTNKTKGLQCCKVILEHLTAEDFKGGNYYEVVYRSLKSAMNQKDLEVTDMVLDCLLKFIKLLRPNVKSRKLSDLFASMLDELETETNLHRKALYFKHIKEVIKLHGVNCALKKKMFIKIACQNAEECSTEAVAEIMMLNVLECLEMWIKYCWCVWQLITDNQLLTTLFKMLYIYNRIDHVAAKIQNMIITLISLCTKEERKQILNNLENPTRSPSKDFLQRIEVIKRDINV